MLRAIPRVLAAALLGTALPAAIAAAQDPAAAVAFSVATVPALVAAATPDSATAPRSSIRFGFGGHGAPDPRFFATATAGQQPLPCWDCNPSKHFFVGFGEMVLVMVIPWSYNYFVRDAEFARVSLDSWWDNITGPWVWDDNKFQTNQFAHPYHGNLYFNSFRTNGYNFWQSAPFAWVGAYLWECCGETHPKAPNDLINTAMGGIALGEVLYRLSSLVLDDRATGSERTWREIGGVALNPVRGFNRLVRGQMNDLGENPPDWRPAFVQAALDVGGRTFTSQGNALGVFEGKQKDLFVALQLVYGRPVEDVTGKPFSTFTLNAELASTPNRQSLQHLTARGNLAGTTLHVGERATHQLALFQNYDFHFVPTRDTAFNAVIYQFGAQSLTGGVVSAFRLSPRLRLNTELLARAVVLGATRSDYYIVTGEGRNYDFGPGAGGQALATLTWARRGYLRLGYASFWLHTVNGTAADHYIDYGVADLRYFLSRRVGVGARYEYYHRDSHYEGNPSTQQTAPAAKLFLTTAIPSLGN